MLDEPTNGLDPAGTREVRRIIGELHAAGTTVFALHATCWPRSRPTCTHVAVLQSGSLVGPGELSPLLRRRAAAAW